MVGIGRSGHGARGVGLGADHRRGRSCQGRVSIVRRGGKQGRKWLGSIITPLANSPATHHQCIISSKAGCLGLTNPTIQLQYNLLPDHNWPDHVRHAKHIWSRKEINTA